MEVDRTDPCREGRAVGGEAWNDIMEVGIQGSVQKQVHGLDLNL